MDSKIERVKSKNLFHFQPQGYYDEDLKGRLFIEYTIVVKSCVIPEYI